MNIPFVCPHGDLCYWSSSANLLAKWPFVCLYGHLCYWSLGVNLLVIYCFVIYTEVQIYWWKCFVCRYCGLCYWSTDYERWTVCFLVVVFVVVVVCYTEVQIYRWKVCLCCGHVTVTIVEVYGQDVCWSLLWSVLLERKITAWTMVCLSLLRICYRRAVSYWQKVCWFVFYNGLCYWSAILSTKCMLVFTVACLIDYKCTMCLYVCVRCGLCYRSTNLPAKGWLGSKHQLAN